MRVMKFANGSEIIFGEDNMEEYLNRTRADYGGESPRGPVTIRVELQQEIQHLQARLKAKEEMLTLMDENPAIEKFINLSRS